MKFKKLISLILSTALLLTIFTGCESNEDYVLYFELDSAPTTLDPQLASGTSEELIVRNLFEGLMRQNSDGEIVKGAAEDYSVSSDGLTYTFILREGAKWSDGEPLTANDFKYALERAVDPTTKAPYVSSLYGIIGAKDINTGKKSDGLGVTATDKKTLVIKLTSPNSDFLKTLTTSVCMPCRQDIFEKAKGQYGKVADHIVSNGSFRLRFWEKENSFSLRLNKNEEYSGDFASETTAVIFNVGEISGRAVRIDDGNLDMGFISVSESTQNSNIFTYEKTCYSLIINKSSPFGSSGFRKAFAKSIHRNRMKNELGKALDHSNCLIPGTVTLNGGTLSSKITVTVPPAYDPSAAHELYIEAAKSTDDLPSSIEIIYFGDDEITSLVKLIAENMQQSLGAVVNTRLLESEEALLSAVKSEEYQLALIPVTASSDKPELFFEQFTKNSANNIYGFNSAKIDSEVSKITSNASEEKVCNAAEAALKEIINDLSLIPVAYYSEAFSYGKDFTCPNISPFGGVIDLALVRKAQ